MARSIQGVGELVLDLRVPTMGVSTFFTEAPLQILNGKLLDLFDISYIRSMALTHDSRLFLNNVAWCVSYFKEIFL